MVESTEPRPSGAPSGAGDFEAYPLTRSEYISAIVHLYRGERGRADAWRARLDPTTNWAVVTVGGMLSFAFSSVEHSHVALILAAFLVIVFLGIEARRFRYFDVWRARVRMLEENFFVPIIRRNLVSPRSDWRESVARDLDHPRFKITFLQAVGIRLRYNYIWIFLVLLMAWLTKLNVHPRRAADFGEVIDRMRMGPVDGWVVGVLVLLAYLALAAVAAGVGLGRGQDEVSGLETEMDHWKT